MAMSLPDRARVHRRLASRIYKVLLVVLVILLVLAVLFVIVYGVGIQHHHSTGDQRAMLAVTAAL